MKTVNMTPTWAMAVEIYMACLENTSEKGKEGARAELRRLARMVDDAKGS